MVLESVEQPVKRGRGRPRKNPLPETQLTAKTEKKETARVVKAEVPSKKTTKAPVQKQGLTWEEELAAFESSSNKSGLLTLLILVLGIALIGYGMYQKIHQEETKNASRSQQVITSVDETIDQALQGETIGTPEEQLPVVDQQPGEATLPQNDTSNLIGQYFDHVNKGETTGVVALQDTSFNTMAALRNYFNINRLAVFVKNTTDGIHISDVTPVTDDPALQRNPTAKVYDFTMSYTLKDDATNYTDAWRGYTVVKGTGDTATTVINGFVYQGRSASTSPFFQFARYNIR